MSNRLQLIAALNLTLAEFSNLWSGRIGSENGWLFSVTHAVHRPFSSTMSEQLRQFQGPCLEILTEDSSWRATLISKEKEPVHFSHLCGSASARLEGTDIDSAMRAFREFRIPHNAEDLFMTLTGKSLTPEEFYWETGSLPRFLSNLGMDTVFGDWRKELAQLRDRQNEK